MILSFNDQVFCQNKNIEKSAKSDYNKKFLFINENISVVSLITTTFFLVEGGIASFQSN